MAGFLLVNAPSLGHAQFAVPPDDVVVAAEPEPPRRTASSARLHVGPVLDPSQGHAGLFGALDVGRRSAGFRLSGTFVSRGTNARSATYGGELWLCPAEFGVLRPVVGAGVGLQQSSQQSEGKTRSDRLGVAILRAGVEFLLPTEDAETRAALSLAGHVPAIVPTVEQPPKTSALLALSLAIGF